MAYFNTDQGGVVNLNREDKVMNCEYKLPQGIVWSGLFRQRTSHEWYRVSATSWIGENSFRSCTRLDYDEALRLVAKKYDIEEIIEKFPELSGSVWKTTTNK